MNFDVDGVRYKTSVDPVHLSAWRAYLAWTCMWVISALYNYLGCKVLEGEGHYLSWYIKIIGGKKKTLCSHANNFMSWEDLSIIKPQINYFPLKTILSPSNSISKALRALCSLRKETPEEFNADTRFLRTFLSYTPNSMLFIFILLLSSFLPWKTFLRDDLWLAG